MCVLSDIAENGVPLENFLAACGSYIFVTFRVIKSRFCDYAPHLSHKRKITELWQVDLNEPFSNRHTFRVEMATDKFDAD